MSQDPSQPPAAKSQPVKPGSQSGGLQKGLQMLQQTWNRVKPVLRTQVIKILRVTIRSLEWSLVKLEAPGIPTSANGVTAAPPQAASAQSTTALDPPAPTPRLDKRHPALERLLRGWNAALGQIRSWLPASWQKLSNLVLTGAIAAALLILLWTTSAILATGEKSPAATIPIAQPVPPADLSVPSELSAPADPGTDSRREFTPSEPVVTPPPIPEFTPSEPVASPSPIPELTPEQKQIATIENQLSELSNSYAEGLILSIQAFPGKRLTVKLNNSWYTLSYSQQDKLAAEILHQVQKYDFSRLEIADLKGTLLARSPTVGTDVVILRRSPVS